MLGMNVIYYKFLSKQEYILFMSSMAVHLTFLQVTGGWLGAAQSYYFAKGLGKAPALSSIQEAGVKSNLVLWMVEFCILLINASSLLVGILVVVLTIAQTQLISCSTRLQLSGKVRPQLEIAVVFCGLLALSTTFIINIQLISAASFLVAHISAAVVALVWAQLRIQTTVQTTNSVTPIDLILIIRYAVPMATWFFLFATNSYLDRYILNLMFPQIDAKNYLLTKELTQGAVSLMTAPFIMVAHTKIFTAFRHKNKAGAEKSMLEYASATLVVSLVLMPILDLAFDVAIRNYVNSAYAHSHAVFLLNYVGILVLCISMYAQKGLEVAGNSRAMVYIIASTLMIQLGLHYIFLDYESMVKFAAINLAAATCYLILVALVGNRILNFRLVRSWWFAGLIVVAFTYIALQLIGGLYEVRYIFQLWMAWSLMFFTFSIKGFTSLYLIITQVEK
ncbi:MAG: hypothetical protein H7240_10750 [Glaciimonas sp.]|nr:hypothetical protein [Glaciimonas sp.]